LGLGSAIHGADPTSVSVTDGRTDTDVTETPSMHVTLSAPESYHQQYEYIYK